MSSPTGLRAFHAVRLAAVATTLLCVARAATYDWSIAFGFNGAGWDQSTFSKAYQDLTISVTDNMDPDPTFHNPNAETDTTLKRLKFNGSVTSNSAVEPALMRIRKTDNSLFTPTGTLTVYYQTYNPILEEDGPPQYQTSTMIIRAYNGSTVTGTTSQSVTGVGSYTVTFSSLTGFSGITSLEFSNGEQTMAIGTLTLGAANSAPTDIALSANSINLSAALANATIGTLSTTDSDSSETFTYALVSGTGSTHNASFAINGSSLRVGASPLAAGSYSLRIQTTDSASNTYQEAFTLTVVDNVPPTIASIVRQNPAGQTLTTNAVTFRVTYSEAVQNVAAGNFEIQNVNGGTVTGTISVSGTGSTRDVTVTLTGGAGEFRLKPTS